MDLKTKYMGLKLRSPIVVSACSLSEKADNIARMEDAGAGAAVLFSLFEEQLQRQKAGAETGEGTKTDASAPKEDFLPGPKDFRISAGKYLEIIRRAKERVDIPVIGSLNGITDEGWTEYARLMQEAGADAIEVNAYYIPTDIRLPGADVEQNYLDILDRVKANVSIPVAIKLNPYFSSPGNMAGQLSEAGADALVLFNRFYQPDFDIKELKALPTLEYSTPAEIRLPLLWIAALYGRINASLAATTGVESAREIIKYLLAGADVVMTASALYKFDIEHLTTMTKGLNAWMDMMQFDNLTQFRGVLSQQNISDTTAYERANYIRILEGRKG